MIDGDGDGFLKFHLLRILLSIMKRNDEKSRLLDYSSILVLDKAYQVHLNF